MFTSLSNLQTHDLRYIPKFNFLSLRPNLTGITSCEKLTAAGIQCSYVYMNSVTYVMKEVYPSPLATIVLLYPLPH